MLETIWKFRTRHPEITSDIVLQKYLKTQTQGSITAQLLEVRQVVAPSAVSAIWEDTYPELYQAAADMLITAIQQKKHLIVFADYDCDGQTASACLVTCLTRCGGDVSYIIPNRLNDGYGLNYELVKEHMKTIARPASECVVITVDNGIGTVDAVDQLKNDGYTVIITDHHIPDTIKLPAADVIVNPKCTLRDTEDEYMVPGVWVAAKLGLWISRKLATLEDQKWLYQYCNTLVGLGIVSDVIELRPKIRQQLACSLAYLNRKLFCGVQRLLDVCAGKFTERPITTNFIGFMVAPKLNAAGRMGNAEVGMTLLMNTGTDTQAYVDASLLANMLKYINMDRKVIENRIFDDACDMASGYLEQHPHSLVLYHPDWHKGVLGIIAARLAEVYQVPTIILGGTDMIEGSGRSVSGFNLHGCLTACAPQLTSFGGHLLAAGVRMTKEQLPAFQEAFERTICATGLPTQRTILIDIVTTISQLVDVSSQLTYASLEPTGNLCEPLRLGLVDVTKVDVAKRNDATYVVINQHGHNVIINAYRCPDNWSKILNNNRQLDVIVEPEALYFSGATQYGYRIVDVKPHDPMNFHDELQENHTL